jgi:polysaccharide pyruvyl transferase WcaK-like protein
LLLQSSAKRPPRQAPVVLDFSGCNGQTLCGQDVKILIGFDFFGAGNIGDDLMLAGFLDALSNRDVELACLSAHDAFSQRQRFPSIQWLASEPLIKEQAIQWCDVWLGLGDSPFQTTSGLWFLDTLVTDLGMCQRESKPVFFLGTGVNDLEALDTVQSRFILPSVDFIWTRDNQSFELLARHLPDGKLGVGADLANISLAKLFPERVAGEEISSDGFVINVEDPLQFSSEAFERHIANSSAPKIRWICQESRELCLSEQTIYQNFSKAAQSRLELALVDYHAALLSELVAPWREIKRCLSTRYHGGLIAAWAGSSVVAYCRNAKVGGLVRDLKLSECSSLRRAEEIESALVAARPVEGGILKGLGRRALEMCREFVTRSGVP